MFSSMYNPIFHLNPLHLFGWPVIAKCLLPLYPTFFNSRICDSFVFCTQDSALADCHIFRILFLLFVSLCPTVQSFYKGISVSMIQNVSFRQGYIVLENTISILAVILYLNLGKH